jgi:hypothetical protein
MFIKDKKHRIHNSLSLLIIYHLYNIIQLMVIFFSVLDTASWACVLYEDNDDDWTAFEPSQSQEASSKKKRKKEKKFKGDAAKKFLLQIHTHTPGRQTERQTDKQAIRKSHYRVQTKGLIERRITYKGNNKHKHT